MKLGQGKDIEASLRKAIDFAVKRRFRKPGAVFGELWKEPTVHPVNRPQVVEPLVRAVLCEKDLSLSDVQEGIKYLHPDYMFSTSAKTILDIARMFSAGRRGIFPLGDGDGITVMHHMWELNRRKYNSSRDYYQDVEDLAKRRA